MAGLLKRGGGGGGSDIPYHPPPSVGHEIGVAFGGIGCMLLGALLFYLWWRVKLARELKMEEDRVSSLKRKGLLDEKSRVSAAEEWEQRVRDASAEM